MVGLVRWHGGCRAQPVHCIEDGVIFVDAVAAAMVLIDALKGDIGCVILD